MIVRVRMPVTAVAAAVSMVVGLHGAHAAPPIERIATSLTDTLQLAVDLLPENVTNVRVGIGPGVYSAFEGSDDYKIRPIPVISLRYRGLIEVDNNEIKVVAFKRLFDQDASVAGGHFRTGPLVSLNFGRGERDSADLLGLGSVGTSLELGAFVSYAMKDTRVRVRARHDVVAGHNGATVIADLTQTFFRSGRFGASGSVAGVWASANYMKAFFGVSATQALASGLPAYRPGSSFKNVSAGLNGSYTISDQWAVFGNVTYERLVSDAADSPLVRLRGSPDQVSFSTFIVFTF